MKLSVVSIHTILTIDWKATLFNDPDAKHLLQLSFPSLHNYLNPFFISDLPFILTPRLLNIGIFFRRLFIRTPCLFGTWEYFIHLVCQTVLANFKPILYSIMVTWLSWTGMECQPLCLNTNNICISKQFSILHYIALSILFILFEINAAINYQFGYHLTVFIEWCCMTFNLLKQWNIPVKHVTTSINNALVIKNHRSSTFEKYLYSSSQNEWFVWSLHRPSHFR